MFPGTGLQASPSKVPTSMCSQECPTGKAKKYHEGESCCWDCFLCAEFQVRKISEDIHPVKNDLIIQTDNTFFRLLVLQMKHFASCAHKEHFLIRTRHSAIRFLRFTSLLTLLQHLLQSVSLSLESSSPSLFLLFS